MKTFEQICEDRVHRTENRKRKAYELWNIMLDQNHPDADSFYEEYKLAEVAAELAKRQLLMVRATDNLP